MATSLFQTILNPSQKTNNELPVMNMDGRDPDPVSIETDGRSSPSGWHNLSDASPISTLPLEVLSIILLLANPKRRFPHVVPFEVTCSHVSRFWRAVALETPGLWHRIDIYSNRSMKWVRHYLERSSQRTLDVYIDIYKSDLRIQLAQDPKVVYQPILRRLLPHLHRFRVLSILCYQQKTLVALQSAFQQKAAPLLQIFVAKYGTNFSAANPNLRLKANVFELGAPNLAFFGTDSPNILPPPPTLRNISTLYLHGLDPSLPFGSGDFIRIFSSLPSLVNLSLQGTVGFGFWPVGMPVAPQFTLNHLKSLRFLDGGGLAIRMLLAVSAPRLESIWFQCSTDNFGIHLFNAVQLNTGRPKFPELKYLTIHTDDLSSSMQFAKIFPNVTHVHYPYANFRQSEKLVLTLTGQLWASVNTLVFSMFREKDAEKLTLALSNVARMRRQRNQNLTLLFAEDHLQFLRRSATRMTRGLLQEVQVAALSTDNYEEYWWNTFERKQQHPEDVF